MTKKVVRTVIDLLKERVYFPDFLRYVFLCVYVLYTHVYDVFDQTPYIGVFGPHGSGKSRLGDILEGLCFRATQTCDTTSAALFRSVDQEKGTVIIDEGLHNQNRSDSLNRILRSGYRRNGRVKCCDPGGSIASFSTYCPKVIVDINEPGDPALLSRIISIFMTRAPHRMKRFRDSESQVVFRTAKGLINAFWEENRSALSEMNRLSQGFDDILNRDEELWTPLLIVSQLLDSTLDKPFFFEKMLCLAHKVIDSKKRSELENNLDLQILEGTRAFIEDKETKPLKVSLYIAFQIRDFIRKRWDLRGLSTKKVVQTLKLYSVCGERKRPRILLSGISQPACYPIDTKTLSEITEKYFDGGGR